jgi:hypothetical protein
MNESPPVSRFLARQDARGTWMVWDGERRGPRETGLTLEQAKELADKLELDPDSAK